MSGITTRTDVTYWVVEDSSVGRFSHLVSAGASSAIAYRNQFMPNGRVEKVTNVITTVIEVLSDPSEAADVDR